MGVSVSPHPVCVTLRLPPPPPSLPLPSQLKLTRVLWNVLTSLWEASCSMNNIFLFSWVKAYFTEAIWGHSVLFISWEPGCLMSQRRHVWLLVHQQIVWGIGPVPSEQGGGGAVGLLRNTPLGFIHISLVYFSKHPLFLLPVEKVKDPVVHTEFTTLWDFFFQCTCSKRRNQKDACLDLTMQNTTRCSWDECGQT